MNPNRTLSVVCFLVLTLVAATLCRHGLPWWTVALTWVAAGGIAFHEGSDLVCAKQYGWDRINVGMAFLMTSLGLFSLALTSFTNLGGGHARIKVSNT